MKAKIVILLFLLFLTLATALIYSQDDATKPRVAILLMKNINQDEQYDAICTSVTDTVELTLKLLQRYRVERVFGIEPYLDLAGAKRYFKYNKFDHAVFGKVDVLDTGEILLTMEVYDSIEDEIIIEEQTSVTDIFQVFDAGEQLAIRVIESFSGVHIGFGRIILVSQGEEGIFDVYINNELVGSNLAAIDRVLNGRHEILIKQMRMLGEHILLKREFEIQEDQELEMVFNIPLYLEREKAVIVSLENIIKENWEIAEKKADVEDAFSRIFNLLEDVSYCKKLLEERWKYEKWQDAYVSGAPLPGTEEVVIKEEPETEPEPATEEKTFTATLGFMFLLPAAEAGEYMSPGGAAPLTLSTNMYFGSFRVTTGLLVGLQGEKTDPDDVLYEYKMTTLPLALDVRVPFTIAGDFYAIVEVALGSVLVGIEYQDDYMQRDDIITFKPLFLTGAGLGYNFFNLFGFEIFISTEFIFFDQQAFWNFCPGARLELSL